MIKALISPKLLFAVAGSLIAAACNHTVRKESVNILTETDIPRTIEYMLIDSFPHHTTAYTERLQLK